MSCVVVAISGISSRGLRRRSSAGPGSSGRLIRRRRRRGRRRRGGKKRLLNLLPLVQRALERALPFLPYGNGYSGSDLSSAACGSSVLPGYLQHNANFLLDCAYGWCYGVKEATFIWYVDVMLLAGFAGDDALRAVTYTVPRSCRQRHFTPKAGFAGYDAPRLCSSFVPAQDLQHLGCPGVERQVSPRW